MTKSTITREQLLEIIETDHVQCGEASYLARMALAAMDSDPVAWRQPFTGCCVSSIFYQDGSSPLDHGYEPLYAAPPEPVVPVKIPRSVYQVIYQECGGFVDCDANAQTIWDACRAAMLAAAPQEVKGE
ncbi:hypothetical protein [Klebsiella pneumoniae]|uniref:hypothetical protein n=1 Tax=Klebsiella pneumoniae TaxID=573 RepID=UPI002072AFE6|nr:hypothetical protein [Klebsiella pneumoniae]HBQ1398514.1 hypothetical protein [Klebsiella pneumoniae]